MEELIKAIITLVIGGVLGGLVKTYFDVRKGIISSLWDQRFLEYKKLWKISAMLPMWPKNNNVTYKKLYECCNDLKNWYFNDGGILLSTVSRAEYETLQTELSVKSDKKSEDKITNNEYENIRELFSTLRSQMTKDLTSRKRQF